jgi:hypothetical protein
MSSQNEMILQLLMLDSGIIPFVTLKHRVRSRVQSDAEMNLIDKRIENLEPPDRRYVKRKFRKLWRKSVKFLDDRREIFGQSRLYCFTCGLNNKVPTPAQRRSRRFAVIAYLQFMSI